MCEDRLVGEECMPVQHFRVRALPRMHRRHLIKFDPFIKSQIASHNQNLEFVWCKFGHEEGGCSV